MKRIGALAAVAVFAIGLTAFAVANLRRRSEFEAWEPSKTSFGPVIELDTSAPGYWWISLRMRLGHLPGGLRAAGQIANWYPSSPGAHYNLATFLYVFNPPRAKREFERALQLDPAYERASRTLRDLQQDLAEGHVGTPRK